MRHFALALLIAAAAPAMAQTECWVEREEAGGKRDPKLAPLFKALATSEKLIAANQAFLATPVPVRMQSSIQAGGFGAYIWVNAYPEKTQYSKVWTGKCGIYPASSAIGAQIGGLGIKFNHHSGEMFLKGHEVPKYEGSVAGYPIYNGYVVITKNGRLPWLPQTLDDRFARELATREKKLAEWRTSQKNMKLPDATASKKTWEMLKETDPAGAEKFMVSMQETAAELARLQADVYPATTRQLEQSVAEVARVRAGFTPAQLAAPATWTDQGGEGRKKLDAQARELRALPAAVKQEIDTLNQENRALTRQMQDTQKARNVEEAERLKVQTAALTARSRAAKQRHDEQAAMRIAELNDRYALEHLQPGDKDNVLAYKADPAFPDQKDINRIQVIAVAFAPKGQAEGRGAWMKAAMDSFDFAVLAGMLH